MAISYPPCPHCGFFSRSPFAQLVHVEKCKAKKESDAGPQEATDGD